MKYSKNFSNLVNEKGQPNLSLEQFKRMMNIIAIENKIDGLKIAKEQNKNKELYHQYDLIIFKYGTVLTDLTGNLNPMDLINEMYYNSN